MAGRDAFRPFWQAEGNVCCLMETGTFVRNLGRTLMILSGLNHVHEPDPQGVANQEAHAIAADAYLRIPYHATG